MSDGFFDNDADWEMAELESQGNTIYRLRAKGICDHGSTQRLTCLLCGRVFSSQAEMDNAWADFESEYL